MLNGLGYANVELSSVCNKSCWMCGRRKRDKEQRGDEYGFMEYETAIKIANEIPAGTMIQLHNNGEGLMHPEFGKMLKLFKHCITNIVSNGKLILKKADEIIDHLDILTISIIQGDDGEEQIDQYTILKKFLLLKGDKKPNVILRFLGDCDERTYNNFNLLHVNRVLHIPDGSRNYTKTPTIPEHGVCTDLLNHLAIDRHGDVSCCVRFDPNRMLVLGNIMYSSLDELWNCEKRLSMIKKHIEGKRSEVPYCGNQCEFWGIATSGK